MAKGNALPCVQGIVGFEEVQLSDAGSALQQQALQQRRQAASATSGQSWKGFSVSLPFLPGVQ